MENIVVLILESTTIFEAIKQLAMIKAAKEELRMKAKGPFQLFIITQMIIH